MGMGGPHWGEVGIPLLRKALALCQLAVKARKCHISTGEQKKCQHMAGKKRW